MKNELPELGNQTHPGPLAWFAGNHVAANLLMIFILAAGMLTLMTIKVEVFPETNQDMIKISVPYLGASPDEVEQGVCLRVEEAIAGVDGIKKINSVAAEGMGSIVAEIEEFADSKVVLDDIKAEVDRIETFPQETEKPIITEVTNRFQVISIAIYGNATERTLKNLADQMRDDLTGMDNISQVDISGVRRYEISIEIAEETLRRYGLTFDQIAQAVAGSSLDLPGGSVKTRGGEILVRTKGQRYLGREFEEIIVVTRNDGTKILLKDIATVIDGFEDSDTLARFNGQRAAIINVYRIGEQGALDVANTVKNYIEKKQNFMPGDIQLATWSDTSKILKSRMNLLQRNAAIGITLVFLCLTFFLDLRLAFWTTMGIPISFIGAFYLLPFFGVSINMISLFAFILALGIVVDDAIVVGENIFDYRQQGIGTLKAAIIGVREMAMPVTIAIATTIAAFTPLLFVEGQMGKIMKTIPIVAISVLAMSLIEALLILPAHLSGKITSKTIGPIARGQKFIRVKLDNFIYGPFEKVVNMAIRWRYATFMSGVALFLIIIGFIVGGHIKFKFLDEVEADNMLATLTMPQGTAVTQTEDIVKILEKTALQVQEEVSQQYPDEKPVIMNMATYLGQQPFSRAGGPGGGPVIPTSGSHLAEINIELTGGEERSASSKAMANRWREIVGEISGISSLTFTSSLFHAGDAVNIQLSHRNFDTLVKLSEQFKERLAQYDGVSEITDDFEPGKLEVKLDLTERGRTLGLTLGELARQVRQGFYGEEVQRIQRRRDDIRVMLRYPESERKTINNINNMRVRLKDGTEVPFDTVANINSGRGYATINRSNRNRIVSVSADVDETVTNSNIINREIITKIIPDLQHDYPDLTYRMEGEQRQQSESMNSLFANFAVALIAIYGLLAVQFRSYAQPVIIMSAIPFGLIGAVLGHLLMGFNLSILSMFGIVALTGVVVNDSLILIDLVNRQRQHPERCDLTIPQIICLSAQRRFRPIILTTLTTFFGLMPMILEKSLQARFLVPMAISLGFGVMFATTITLLIIPSLYMILEDVKAIFPRRKND